MKYLILAMILTVPAGAIASNISRSDIIATVEHQRKLAHEAQAEATTAKQELIVIQDAINTQTAKLHDTENRLDIAQKELSTTKHHLHLLLLLCSSLIGAIAFVVIQRYSSILLAFYPPALAADWFVSIGSGIIAGGAAWIVLGHL